MARRAGSLAGLTVLLALAIPASAAAATINVSSTADDGSGGCTLREAVAAAQNNVSTGGCAAGGVFGTDTISVPANAAHYTLAGTPGDDINDSGDLDIASNVVIAGAGPAKTVVDANQVDRVFDVQQNTTVELRDMTITGGKTENGQDMADAADATAAPNDSEGLVGGNGGPGGGIRNLGSLTLTRVTVSSNQTGRGGHGGNAGDVTYVATAGNAGGKSNGGNGGVGGNGGAIANLGSATLTLSASTITQNAAGGGGTGGDAGSAGQGGSGSTGATGGQTNAGTFGHTGTGGRGGEGGAIYNVSTSPQAVTIDHSTISHNITGDGGLGGFGGLGGTGGTGTSGPGGNGGDAHGGLAGDGGAGGAIALEDGGLDVSDSTISDSQSGHGGQGGLGGQGGNTGSGNTAGTGGRSLGGDGGDGGSYAGVHGFGDSENFTRSAIVRNAAGDGGTGGEGQFSGAPAAGSANGDSRGGAGGAAGDTGGIALLSGPGATVTDSTIAGNASGAGGTGGAGGSGFNTSRGGDGGPQAAGGGVKTQSTQAALRHVTIVGNTIGSPGSGGDSGDAPVHTAGSGGASAMPAAGGISGSLLNDDTLQYSIVANNGGTQQCAGSFDGASTLNIEFPSTGTCQGSKTLDPQLGPLQDNGGPTPTMLPADGSPAIDTAGTGAACTSADQRGVTRPKGSECDVGAVEKSKPSATTGAAGPIAKTSAKLNGTLGSGQLPAKYRFQYGTTPSLGSQTALLSAGGTAATATLAGLAPNTTYFFRLVVTNPDGTATGATHSFKTLASPATPPFTGVTIVSKKAKAGKKRKAVKIVLACPAPALTPCKGTLTLTARVKKGKKKKAIKVGTATFTIAAGKSATIKVKLSKNARKALKKKLKAKATALATDARGGTPVKTTGKVTIKAPKKKKKK